MKCPECVKLPEYGKKSKNWKGPRMQFYWRCMYCGRKTKDDGTAKEVKKTSGV